MISGAEILPVLYIIIILYLQEDPTVDEPISNKRENNSEVMSGMVRSTHRESGHLVFTAR